MNNWPIDTWAITPYTTRGTLGGIIGPMVEEAAVTAAANSGGYPSFFIASISIAPNPAASAVAAPVIPAKMMLASTFTYANPPRICPRPVMQNLKIASAPPPLFSRIPASTKKGIASKGKLSNPPHIRCGTTTIGTFPAASNASNEEISIANDTGTLSASNTIKLIPITQ